MMPKFPSISYISYQTVTGLIGGTPLGLAPFYFVSRLFDKDKSVNAWHGDDLYDICTINAVL